MELQFKKNRYSCLDTVLREVQNTEQTQEVKLPDGMPDIGHVLASWGQTILRSKEWRGDSVALSGGIMVWTLYAPEDGTAPQCIEGWIPFQMKWELPDHTPEGKIRIGCLTRFVDARSVSARKMMIRAGAAVMAEAFSPKELQTYTPDDIPENVELLRTSYPVRLPVEAGEKTFQMDEDLTLPASAPLPEKMVYYTLSPSVTDQKVLANKVVFRGNANLHILYISEEGQLHSWNFELPFSQFAELDGSYSTDAQMDMRLCPTGLELDLDDEGHMRLKCGIVGQYVVTEQQMLELVEDAYSPGRALHLQIEELELPAVLENRRENIYGEQTIPAEANMAADVSFLPDYPRQNRTENGVEMEIPGTFQVLYYGEDGILRSATGRWEGRHSVRADENSRITAVPMANSEPEVLLGSGTMTARTEIPVQMFTTTASGIPMVTGFSMGEEMQQDSNRPSLILRRAGDARLWDIAKNSGSTVDAIRRANHLQDEPAPGQILLIPVS